MKVSIIIPMYNSENTIEKTIESITNQKDFDKCEVILIDDCSKDNTVMICEEISKKFSNIRLLKNEINLGICKNRNKGIENATGDYITFCDDDDELLPNFISDQLNIINNEKNIDMIKFGRELVSINAKNEIFERKQTKNNYEGILDEKNKYKEYFNLRKSFIFNNVWNGFYSKKFIDKYNIYFDENMKYGSEDANFTYTFFLKSKKIYINKNIYYKHYKMENESTSRRFNKNKIYSLLETLKTENQIWKNLDRKNQKNIYGIDRAINSYLNSIMIEQLFHQKSNMNYHDRKKAYYNFYEDTKQMYVFSKKTYKEFFKEDKKHLIIYLLRKMNIYLFIDVFYRIYSFKMNKKWR